MFVALELPEVVAGELARWQGSVMGDGIVGAEPALRAVGRESLHVTLCFLGARPASALGAVGEAMNAMAGRPVRELALGAAVWLPSRRRPRVLAVAVDDPLGQVAVLQGELSEALAAAGLFKPEARRFLPHVTVARVRGQARVQRRPLEGPAHQPFSASHITLYRSRLGGGPARYEALHRTELSRR